MANNTPHDHVSVLGDDVAKTESRLDYVGPEIVVIGSATELTQGGSYNDYDSPGVRKT